MKKFNSGLFWSVFALLICILGFGNAFAQELGDPPCCINLPKAIPESAPAVDETTVTQELGDPPCCINLPKAAPESIPYVEGAKVAQELGDPHYGVNMPKVEPTLSTATDTL
jgi:hypothetical protein